MPTEKPINTKSGNLLALPFSLHHFKRYFENLSWLLLEKAVSLAVAMVVGIYVARYLQPEQYGLLNYSISFVGIFSMLSTLGIDQIIVRELSKDLNQKDTLLGTSFLLKTVGALCLMGLLALITLFIGHDRFTNTLIFIIALAEIFKAFEVVNYFFQAKVLSKYVVHVQLVTNLTLSVIKIGLVYFGAPLLAFAWAILIGAFLNAIGFLYIYSRREGGITKWQFKKSLAKMILSESWPLIIYGVALHIQARIDQVMLGKMLNNYEVGQYSVALKLIEMIGFIPMIMLSTFSPAITRAKETSQALYDSRLVNFYRLMFLLFLVIAIPLYFFADQIVVFLYGKEYAVAGLLLSLFAIRLFFTNIGVAKSSFIVNESLFKYSLLVTIVGAALNIAINYMLIPVYASAGAIVATIVSFTVSIFVLDFFFAKTRRNQKLIFKGIFTFWKLNNIT